jgi:signal transduction histidine kinase
MRRDEEETGLPPDSIKRFHLGTQKSRVLAYAVSFAAFFVPKAFGIFEVPVWHAAALFAAVVVSIGGFYLAYLYELDRRLGIPLAPLWIATDVLFTTYAVHITGGAGSPWFVWYLGPAGAAAFVLGTRAANVTHVANYLAYLAVLGLRGELVTMTDFYLATTKMFFLFAASYFLFEGIATLKIRRLTIRRLQAEETRKVEELTILNEQLERLAAELDTKSRELEASNSRLTAANEQIRESDRRKSEFLASMSHELRTPLNAILGFGEVLHGALADQITPRQSGFLESIVVSGRHLLDLINDVLDLSKVESGRMELHPEPVAVGPVIEDVRNVLRGTAGRQGILIVNEIEADLPPIHTDPAKLRQILYNLTANAVKFSPREGVVTLRAIVERTASGRALAVSVTDRGIGIDEDEIDMIFDEFRQARGASHGTFGGTGLGLALVKRFVEMQGGTIRVASEPGLGSTFTFSFPISVAEHSDVRPPHPASDPVSRE